VIQKKNEEKKARQEDLRGFVSEAQPSYFFLFSFFFRYGKQRPVWGVNMPAAGIKRRVRRRRKGVVK